MKTNLFAVIGYLAIVVSCGCSNAPVKEPDKAVSVQAPSEVSIVVPAPEVNNAVQASPEMRKRIAGLISRLGAETQKERDLAEQELISIGESVKEQIIQTIETGLDPEIVARAKYVKEAIKPVRIAPGMTQIWKEINAMSGAGLNAPDSEWGVKIDDAVAKAKTENPDISRKSFEMFSHICKARIDYIFFTWGWSVKRGHSFMWYARDPNSLPEPQKTRNRICHDMEQNIIIIRDFLAKTAEDAEAYEKARKNLSNNSKELFDMDNVDGLGVVSDSDAIEIMKMITEMSK